MDSEEQAFRAALSVRPEDEFTRGVFADWLDDHERYDEAAKQRLMAPGYRALVGRSRKPREIHYGSENKAMYCFAHYIVGGEKDNAHCGLPDDWFRAIPVPDLDPPLAQKEPPYWRDYHTAEQATDAAALAFSNLPAERQAELLAQEVPA